MTRYYRGTSGNDYAKATKTKRRFWWNTWESWFMEGFAGNDTLIGTIEYSAALVMIAFMDGSRIMRAEKMEMTT